MIETGTTHKGLAIPGISDLDITLILPDNGHTDDFETTLQKMNVPGYEDLPKPNPLTKERAEDTINKLRSELGYKNKKLKLRGERDEVLESQVKMRGPVLERSEFSDLIRKSKDNIENGNLLTLQIHGTRYDTISPTSNLRCYADGRICYNGLKLNLEDMLKDVKNHPKIQEDRRIYTRDKVERLRFVRGS